LKVGGDVLSFISMFLSWEKVKLQREWKASGGGVVWSCHISPCSRMILTSSGDDFQLWDTASGLLKRTFKGHTGTVESCRFFPDGKTVVSASCDETLKVWDVASGSLVRTLVGHRDYVWGVDVSPDNARILSASSDETWKLWNSRTGELQHTEQMDGCSNCCSFSPNGSLLLVGRGSNLRLYDSTTSELQHTLTGHGNTVMSCSFAPDGATILSGSDEDCTMKLWSTTTGQCLRTLDGHFDGVVSCSFSPSGHGIYSASYDGLILMWTAATGKVEGVIHADPTNKPWSICTSSDGKRIVSGHSDGTVRVFSVSGV
jgi:WD40 repeat protein